jgi:glucosamine-6-phosphate deaminase
MDAREMIIMANGISKSLAIRECIEGAISAQFTCTVAQNHQKAIVICDELATNELKVKTLRYYKSLQQNIDLAGNPKFNKLL